MSSQHEEGEEVFFAEDAPRSSRRYLPEGPDKNIKQESIPNAKNDNIRVQRTHAPFIQESNPRLAETSWCVREWWDESETC